jgi:hypothetical protein
MERCNFLLVQMLVLMVTMADENRPLEMAFQSYEMGTLIDLSAVVT